MSFSDMFSNPFIAKVVIKALVVGILVALCASLLGVSLVLKRLSLIGDGLSHVGFGALAIATVLDLGDYSMEVSIPIVVVSAFILLKLSESKKIKGDAAIALFSTGAIAIGSLIYNYSGNRNTDICNSLFGSASIITIGTRELVLSIILSVAVIAFFVLFYNRIFAVTFDEDFSKATGVKSDLYKLLIAALTAVTIVLGMKLLGAIMISAIIIFPPLTSMRLCKSFRSVVICSAAVSAVCFVIGFFAACRLSYQTGATVASVNLAAFLIFALIGALGSSKRFREFRAMLLAGFKKIKNRAVL